MKSTLQKCTLVVRRFGDDSGIRESDLDVASLEQLFDHCLSLAEEHLLERLVVEGRDRAGHWRTLTFTFQSASERD
ncbi:MAG TPA: hypothetical protein VHU19_10835 [Pyrinomonadaceae bacterium]|jgi:hypothetical protein|nr:hypothetical protein [Pyrinomonadaceae bacterium]